MIRTENDDCLLCANYKAIRTNSHIVPSTILNNVHGERDKEHSFVFSSDTTTIDEYFGREFSQLTSTEIKKSNFSSDYILCNNCENYFSQIENIVNPILKNIDLESNINKLKKIDLKDTQLKIIQNINGGIIQLYFYSIIWRLIIQDYIENGTIAKPIVNSEVVLRKTINDYSNIELKGLKKISFNHNLHLYVVTTLNEEFPISQLYNIYTENPFVFIAGRFILFLFDTDNKMDEESNFFFSQIQAFINKGDDKFKIVYIPLNTYDNMINRIFKRFIQHFDDADFEKLKSNLNDKLNNEKGL